MSFLEDQHEKALAEIKDLREKLTEIKEKLSHAEEALMFYSNPKSYMVAVGYNTERFQCVVRDDNDTADNSENTKIAGARARKYFRRYENLPSP